ncbi:MAG: RraA family protein [Pseudoclavibacter sp.]
MSDFGWRHNPAAPAIAGEAIATLAATPTSLLSDVMGRLVGARGIRPFHRPSRLAGTAVTVHTRAGDNLAVYRALRECRPGDVLVIDGGGDRTQALMGDIMTRYAESRGAAGVVIDGAIRDVDSIMERTFPVYAAAATHRGPFRTGPGEVNVPVSVGGMVVLPGDAIAGDENGIVAIRPADLPEVLTRAAEKWRHEEALLAAIDDERFELEWVPDAVQRSRLL